MLDSSLSIVAVQISLRHSFDEVNPADPFMVMIPPLGQYRNDYSLLFMGVFLLIAWITVVFKQQQLIIPTMKEKEKPYSLLSPRVFCPWNIWFKSPQAMDQLLVVWWYDIKNIWTQPHKPWYSV